MGYQSVGLWSFTGSLSDSASKRVTGWFLICADDPAMLDVCRQHLELRGTGTVGAFAGRPTSLDVRTAAAGSVAEWCPNDEFSMDGVSEGWITAIARGGTK
jgi:hypothetical protein